MMASSVLVPGAGVALLSNWKNLPSDWRVTVPLLVPVKVTL